MKSEHLDGCFVTKQAKKNYLKGITKLKTNFWPEKRINILRYLVLTTSIFDLFSWNFLLFYTLKKKPSRSGRSAPGVKEKCVRGQGEVCRGSRKSVSGVT